MRYRFLVLYLVLILTVVLAVPGDLFSKKMTSPDDEGRIIVKYKSGRDTATARSKLRTAFGMKAKKHLRRSNMHVYSVDKRNQKAILRQLKNHPDIAFAEPDHKLTLQSTIPNEPEFYYWHWNLHNPEWYGTPGTDIDAHLAWDLTTGSSNVIAAVIDSGIDYNHEDLKNNMWINPGETAGDGIDNDGNGYIDDVYGINSVTGSGDPMDIDDGHGTHVAGVIGAEGNNGKGVVGVCWDVSLMALKFTDWYPWGGYTSDAVECIDYAVAKGAHIINCSFGTYEYSQALYDSIQNARDNGILVVCAAGNYSYGDPFYPGSFDLENIIEVAATDYDDQLRWYSNSGVGSIDLAAPGYSIYSTNLPDSYGDIYDTWGGTSQAAAHVTGVAALLKSYDPGLTWQQIKQRILDTVDKRENLNGHVNTGGRLNAYYALINQTAPTVSFTQPADNDFVAGTVELIANAVDDQAISKVEFYIDGQLALEDLTAPYQHSWDTTLIADGQYTVKAIAYDTTGRINTEVIKVNVNNSGSPAVVINSPADGDSLMGYVPIRTEADYAGGLSRVEFYIDDVKIGEDTTEPYEFTWESWLQTNGTHTVKAVAVGLDSSTGQHQITVTTNNSGLPAAERNALIALYNACNGDDWWNNTNWKKKDGSFNDPGTEHTWGRVVVTGGHVTRLWIYGNNLTGALPAELQNLTYLEVLEAENNLLSGSFPTVLYALPALRHLELQNNSFSGSIPPELGNMTTLTYLNIEQNNFTGAIPPQLGNLTNLTKLRLCYNNLTGTIPPELGNLVNLGHLDLSGNQLTGTIPPELGNLSVLIYLYLEQNQLSGSIPPELGNLSNLLYLLLYENNLDGTIPLELTDIPGLYSLSLYSNQLTGPVPAELAQLPELRYLILRNNQLTGTIPVEMGSMTNLYSLDLSNNQLTGTIPTELANCTDLTWLKLGDNQLTGSIPAGFFSHAKLYYFIAPNNLLSGPIPQGIGTWSNLRNLDISGNQFSGAIPTEMGNLTGMSELNMSNNRLTGAIPDSFGNLVNLNVSHLNGNMLTGQIPASLKNCEAMTDAVSAFGYNGFYIDPADTLLLSFVNAKDPDWASTQTVPPSNVTAIETVPGTVRVSWAPITYTGDTGGYRVSYSLFPGGPYTESGTTAAKTDSFYDVTGLTPGMTYFFIVQTVTQPHGGNSNAVVSDTSAEAAAPAFSTYTLTVDSTPGSNVAVTVSPVDINGDPGGSTAFNRAFNAGTVVSLTAPAVSGGLTFDYWDINGSHVNSPSIQVTMSTNYSVTAVYTAVDHIRLYAPNGGEKWIAGTVQTITWSSYGVVGNVSLDYSIDNGATWTPVTASTANTGAYDWTIPYHVSYRCLTRISGVDGGGSPMTDTSDAVFTILYPPLPEAERNALIDLYNSTNGDNWEDNSNWKVLGQFNEPGTESTWFGVTVTGNTVTIIDLGGNGLSGPLPVSIAGLSGLKALRASYQSITGPVPPELGNLTNLESLSLSGNLLEGQIPPELGNCPKLKFLGLRENRLIGPIPAELANCPLLEILYLSDNYFSGALPPELGNLSNLRHLFVGGNQLTGSIPPEYGNLTNLRWLSLSYNTLDGTLPPGLGNLTLLDYIHIRYTGISGPIPPELGNLPNLKQLWLDNNSLTGTIPPELGNLTTLWDLYLGNNQLTGSIPPELGNLSSLSSLSLNSNQLSGSIPPELANPNGLQSLHLSENQLTGAIPPELANMKYLRILYLRDNQLSGNIPVEFGNFQRLESMALSGNQLTGTIPVELFNISTLKYLYLDRNELTGSIPTGIANVPLVYLDLSQNHFSGPLPAEFGNLASLQRLNLSGNMLSGPLPGTLTGLISLSYRDTDFGYNMFYIDEADTALRDFLLSKDADWADTQTIVPTGVSAAPLTAGSVEVTWTPITYTGDPGGYRVHYAATPGGPYTYFGSTADKTAFSHTVTGLNPSTAYYFVVSTRTGSHEKNPNTVDSGYSTEVSTATPELPQISVTSPNGGENWTAGTTQAISWTSSGMTGNVDISYSTTGSGGTFIPVASNVADSGSYSWTVPDTDSAQCVVRVAHTSGTPADVSDAVFTISPVPSITLTSPNGGDTWTAGTAQTITWTYENLTGDVTVQLYKGGAHDRDLGTAAAADGSFSWNIPLDLTGNDYTVRVFQGSAEDVSDAVFTIKRKPAFADFNKDGKPDLLWRYYSTGGKNLVWFMDNATRTGYQYLNAAANLDWKIEGTGDFNNDGNTDIVWRNYAPGDGRNIVWYMDGTTKIGHEWLPRTYNLDWKIAGIGDFNGDGKPDIVWRYEVSGIGRNVVWFMDGVKKTGHQYFNPVANTNWKLESINDFNGDGKPDILWRYYTGPGYVVVWYMDGAVKTGHSYLPSSTNFDWKIEGTGDFNGDGSTDILWRNHGTGANVIWYMNGAVKMGHTFFTTVGNLNWDLENN